MKGEIDFTPINRLIERIKSLSDDAVWKFVANRPDVKRRIITLNTIDQLFDEGIDSKGVSLGIYSDFTKAKKKHDGLPWNRVTLFQDGDFYRSFVVIVTISGWDIEAEDDKGDKALFEVYGEDVKGLTPENIEKLKEFVIPIVQDYVYKQLLS